MSPRTPGFTGRYIVLADEDRAVVSLVIDTLLRQGHAVFQTRDARSAIELAAGLKVCDLVISNTRVGGRPGVALIHDLRARVPRAPFLYLTNKRHSSPEIEQALPSDVVILREPFSGEELLVAVGGLLPLRD
jgi:DNA-binding response OmpR family regulator